MDCPTAIKYTTHMCRMQHLFAKLMRAASTHTHQSKTIIEFKIGHASSCALVRRLSLKKNAITQSSSSWIYLLEYTHTNSNAFIIICFEIKFILVFVYIILQMHGHVLSRKLSIWLIDSGQSRIFRDLLSIYLTHWFLIILIYSYNIKHPVKVYTFENSSIWRIYA